MVKFEGQKVYYFFDLNCEKAKILKLEYTPHFCNQYLYDFAG